MSTLASPGGHVIDGRWPWERRRDADGNVIVRARGQRLARHRRVKHPRGRRRALEAHAEKDRAQGAFSFQRPKLEVHLGLDAHRHDDRRGDAAFGDKITGLS